MPELTTYPTAIEVASALCKRFEGLRLKPYLCPAGIPTIGYGATFYTNGKKVTLEDPAITEPMADALLRYQLNSVFIPGVKGQCPNLNPSQLGAITSFAFNLGLTRLKGSTLRKRLNEGNIPAATVELKKWNRGGGKILPGLVLRRDAEATFLNA